MNDVTPYPAINTVLTEWAEGLKRLLGKKIVGLYLSGSLAYGDFVPDRSDIDLFQEWVPKIDDAAWLANSHYQSYLVLNLCRILRTVIHGDPGSKKVAAQWAKAKYPQWKNLIAQAEKWAHGDEMKRQADAVAFLRFAVDRVSETKLLSAEPSTTQRL